MALNVPYDHIRERLLYGTFSWPDAQLELCAWADGAYFPSHIRVSDLVAAGGVQSSVSTLPIVPTVGPGGYASTGNVVLPGTGFVIGQLISFLTLNDRKDAVDDPKLLLFCADVEGLPFFANGLDVLVAPDWLSSRAWWRP
jgi:hypothetical protein